MCSCLDKFPLASMVEIRHDSDGLQSGLKVEIGLDFCLIWLGSNWSPVWLDLCPIRTPQDRPRSVVVGWNGLAESTASSPSRTQAWLNSSMCLGCTHFKSTTYTNLRPSIMPWNQGLDWSHWMSMDWANLSLTSGSTTQGNSRCTYIICYINLSCHTTIAKRS